MGFIARAIGGIFSPPKAPALPPPPPPPPPVPTKAADKSVQEAEKETRRRAAAAQGRAGTILTGGAGLLDGDTTKPTRRAILGG